VPPHPWAETPLPGRPHHEFQRQRPTRHLRSSRAGGGGGGGRGGMVVGGGIGGIIIAILDALGHQPGDVPGGSTTPADTARCAIRRRATRSKSSARPVPTPTSTSSAESSAPSTPQAFWSQELPDSASSWSPARSSTTARPSPPAGRRATRSARSTARSTRRSTSTRASSDPLTQKFGARRRSARAGVCRGPRVRPPHPERPRPARPGAAGPAGADNSGAVRIELMADCFGGMWAKHASRPRTQTATLPQAADRTRTSVDALSAARPSATTSIQEKTQGRVNPENWTHGSAEARQRWFLQGMKAGDHQQVRHLRVDDRQADEKSAPSAEPVDRAFVEPSRI
jgi:predicted metalloprotease